MGIKEGDKNQGKNSIWRVYAWKYLKWWKIEIIGVSYTNTCS